MGTVTHLGWSTSEDDIPQPTSIIMGRNLRTPAPEAPQPPVPEDPQGQPSKMRPLQPVSLEEARRRGISIGNDLIISPTPSRSRAP
jgi:hypothetical protein